MAVEVQDDQYFLELHAPLNFQLYTCPREYEDFYETF